MLRTMMILMGDDLYNSKL